MVICSDKHQPKYLIIYKSPHLGGSSRKWTVCDYCYENKRCFNDPDEIESLTRLDEDNA